MCVHASEVSQQRPFLFMFAVEDHIHSLLLQSGTSETCTRTVFDDHAREELTLEVSSNSRETFKNVATLVGLYGTWTS
jgi:hypothetical protein